MRKTYAQISYKQKDHEFLVFPRQIRYSLLELVVDRDITGTTIDKI